MNTPWNAASYKARHYKVPKRTTPKPIGPSVVDLVGHAGALVNGLAVPYESLPKLTSEFLDGVAACEDCGFMICGCDRRCDDCGSLLHKSCGPDEELSEFATQAALAQGVIDAFIADREPPEEASPVFMLGVLDQWSTTVMSSSMADTDPREWTRAASWRITRDGIVENYARLTALFRGGTPEDFKRAYGGVVPASSVPYTFPIQQSIAHGQTAHLEPLYDLKNDGSWAYAG